MFAVVQIGSSTRRSACITALMVRAAEACALARMIEGPDVSAAAARPPARTLRRVVFMIPSALAVAQPCTN
jgi:hypothetical protein